MKRIKLHIISCLVLGGIGCQTSTLAPEKLTDDEFTAAYERVAEQYEPELREQIEAIEVIDSFFFDLNADLLAGFVDPVNDPTSLSFTFDFNGALKEPLSREEFLAILTDTFADSGYDLGVVEDSLTMDDYQFLFDGFRILEPLPWRSNAHAQNP